MLAIAPPNPVVFRAYADPVVWSLAMLAMWGEIKTATWLLRARAPAAELQNALLLLNIWTWIVFLVGVDRIHPKDADAAVWVAVLEVAVVVVETICIWAGVRIWARRHQRPAIGVLQAAWVALVANLVSVVISLIPIVVVLLFGQRR